MKRHYIVLFQLMGDPDTGSWQKFSNEGAARSFYDSLLISYGPARLAYRCMAPWPPENFMSSGKLTP